jgi:hypothetical protein
MSPLITSSRSADQRTGSPIMPSLPSPSLRRAWHVPHPGNRRSSALSGPGWHYSARSTSAGLSRAVARPGQNATALAIKLTAGTLSSTGQIGVRATSGTPRPRPNSVQLHRPAATPSGRPAATSEPGQGADLPGGDRADLPPEQPESLQDGEITPPPPSRHHDELPEHGNAEDGEHRGEDRGSAAMLA